ncbi:MAG: DNA mismatch repair protein MutS [Methylococcaceae bacterium]|nr:DNA mismatch repair protein MutS [Methylococcaceae bacterium]
MTTINAASPTILQSDSRTPPRIPSAWSEPTGRGVIDETTFRTIEVVKLFDTIGMAGTRIGQAVLYRSLTHPLATTEAVQAKQDALKELEARPELRDAVVALVRRSARREEDFYRLLFGNFLGWAGRPADEMEVEGYGYESFIKGTGFMLDMVEGAAQLPAPESAYLQDIVGDIRRLSESRAGALARGPIYRSEKGILTAAEKSWLTPAIKFRPSLFKPGALLTLVVGILAALEFVPLLLEIATAIAPLFWLILPPLALVYIPIVGSMDRDGVIYPLREIFKRSPELQQALDALGKLDELLNFLHLRDNFGHPMTLPKVVEAPAHAARLKGVRNPILAKGNADYVANDLDLAEERLPLVTGPNSGGKTAFCKTLAQTQLLAQIGCYVPADSAELTVADHIFYQAPEISQLTDGEGRFGTELKRTKEIFMATTARSLVIMDELSEGTTHEEKIEISTDILNGFRQRGCSTLLITHNHELVEHFQAQGVGHARQVEFKNDQPTYRLIEGISKVSHADRVARKIGFAKEDIARMLGQGK